MRVGEREVLRMDIVVASIAGSVVGLIEDIAVAVAAGAVAGTFGGATAGLVNGWSRTQVERDAFRDGHIGAMVAFGFWLLDLCNV